MAKVSAALQLIWWLWIGIAVDHIREVLPGCWSHLSCMDTELALCLWMGQCGPGVEMKTRSTSWSMIRIICLGWTFELDRYGWCLHTSVMSVFGKDDGIVFTTKYNSFQICPPNASPAEREVLQSRGFFWVCLQLWCCEWSDSPSTNTAAGCLWQNCVFCSDAPSVDFEAWFVAVIARTTSPALPWRGTVGNMWPLQGMSKCRHVQTKEANISPEGVGKPVCWALQLFEEDSPSILLSHLTGSLQGHHPLPLPVMPQPWDSILHPGNPLGWHAAGWVCQSRGRVWVCTAAKGSITCRDPSCCKLHSHSLAPQSHPYHVLRDTPACAPYIEDMNAWPCTELFLSL